MHDLDERLITRLKKLMALSTNNPNEHEATAAAEKLQELLEQHNLDMAVLNSPGTAKRSDTKRAGGLYTWQRRLWDGVANLNFCLYFSLRGLARGSQYEHRLIGSQANVIATELMAEYLQATVERLAQTWAKQNGYNSVFVRDAIAYREGMAERIVSKLNDRRRAMVTKARQEAEERKRDEARADTAPSGTGLTIVDIISTEADFNNDYLQGWEMGTTAQRRHEADIRSKAWQAEWERQRAERDEAERLNPELKRRRLEAEAKALAEYLKDEERRKKRRNKTPPKPRERAQTAEEKRRGLSSYWRGYDDGEKVGIDTQVDGNKTARIV